MCRKERVSFPIPVMRHHVSIFQEIPYDPEDFLIFLDNMQSTLPQKYSFENEQQKRDMAARMIISRRALERGNAVIIPDDQPGFECERCPYLEPCFEK